MKLFLYYVTFAKLIYRFSLRLTSLQPRISINITYHQRTLTTAIPYFIVVDLSTSMNLRCIDIVYFSSTSHFGHYLWIFTKSTLSSKLTLQSHHPKLIRCYTAYELQGLLSARLVLSEAQAQVPMQVLLLPHSAWFLWLVTPGGGGGCRWGSKTWPCRNALGAQKIHPVTIYLTKKKIICIPCRNIAPSLVPRSRACHKYCGFGTPGKQPCDKWSNPPVANYADLDTLCQYWWPQEGHKIPCANIDDRKRATRYPVLILMKIIPCPAARPRHLQYGSAPPPPPPRACDLFPLLEYHNGILSVTCDFISLLEY